MMAWLSVVAVIAIGILGWNLYRRFGADRFEALSEKRRATSRLVSTAEYVDGNRHLQVVLALTATTLFYENSDTQGSIDLQWLREIEYDTELAASAMTRPGKVLRLRSNSQTFEFVLADDVVPRWHMMLPPRRAAGAVSHEPQVAAAT